MAEIGFGAALANLGDLAGKAVTVVLGSGATLEIKDFKVGPAKLAIFGVDVRTEKQIVINPHHIAALRY